MPKVSHLPPALTKGTKLATDREGAFDWQQVTDDTRQRQMKYLRRGIKVEHRTIAIEQHFY